MKTLVLQALKSVPCLIFSLLIFLFAVNSCKKDDSNHRPLEPLIAEAKKYFDTQIATQPEKPIDDNLRHTVAKKPLWNKAYTKTISIGQAVIVPLEYSSEIFTKVGKNQDKVYLKDISYLMLYKDKQGKFQAEVVTRIPDKEYWDSGKAAGKNFSGIVMVEDCWGKTIKSFQIEADQHVKYLSRSIEKKNSRFNPDSGEFMANELASWCNEIAWFSCGRIGGENHWYCHYDYSELFSCEQYWGDDDGSSGGNDSGLPGDEDYNEHSPGGGGGSGRHNSGRGGRRTPGEPNNPTPSEREDNPPPPASNGLDTTMSSKFYQNEKARCALNKLMQNNYYKTALNQFIGENKPIDLNFKIAPIPNEPGEITYGIAHPEPLNWDAINIDLTLNENIIGSLPSIQVALTLLHEGIHAEIYRKILSINGPSNLDINNFPTLFNMYAKYKNTGEGADYQHQFLASYYIGIMGNALKQYDNNKFSIDYYQALAWQGLKGTEAYTSLDAPAKADIQSKITTLLANRNNTNCNDL